MVTRRRQSKTAVYARLKRAILRAELKPGEPISERQLAHRYRLSRTPVREILHRLQHEHLVVRYPHRGAFVRQAGAQDVLEIFQAREAVEPAAAYLAAAVRDLSTLLRLERQFLALPVVDTPAARSALVAQGRRLHDYIVSVCGNRYLQQMYEILRDQATLIRRITRRHFAIEQESYRWHLRILEALKRGDPETAEAAMRGHLRRTREELLRWMLSAQLTDGVGPNRQQRLLRKGGGENHGGS